jgi:hypothetical protein
MAFSPGWLSDMRSSGTNARSNDKSGQGCPILECFKAARLRDIAETRDIAPAICSQEIGGINARFGR